MEIFFSFSPLLVSHGFIIKTENTNGDKERQTGRKTPIKINPR